MAGRETESNALLISKDAMYTDLNFLLWNRSIVSRRNVLSAQPSVLLNARCLGPIPSITSILLAKILCRPLTITDGIVIGRKSPGSTASAFLGRKIVLDLSRFSGSFLHHHYNVVYSQENSCKYSPKEAGCYTIRSCGGGARNPFRF